MPVFVVCVHVCVCMCVHVNMFINNMFTVHVREDHVNVNLVHTNKHVHVGVFCIHS